MTQENIKAATPGIAETVAGENPKLYQEVIKLVENMPDGVSGLVKQFQDKGLRNIAASLTGKGTAQTISPEQIVQGLGTEKVNALATASGLDVKVVRVELVKMLPKVVQQLSPADKAVGVAVTA